MATQTAPVRADVQLATASMEHAERASFRAKREPCALLAERVERAMTGVSRDSVLLGRLADAAKPGDCWSVFYEGGEGNEVAGVLDTSGLDILFAWKVPSG